jgi:ribosome-associated protein
LTRPARRSRARSDADQVRELASTAAAEAVERKGTDVALLDLRGLTTATDWFVLVSGESDIQVRSIAERIEERLGKDFDARPWHVEGLKQTRWVLLDYVDFVVHVWRRARSTTSTACGRTRRWSGSARKGRAELSGTKPPISGGASEEEGYR